MTQEEIMAKITSALDLQPITTENTYISPREIAHERIAREKQAILERLTPKRTNFDIHLVDGRVFNVGGYDMLDALIQLELSTLMVSVDDIVKIEK